MTSFFDSASSKIREAADKISEKEKTQGAAMADRGFLAEVLKVENEVLVPILQLIKDQEFPADSKMMIEAKVARFSVQTEHGRQHVVAVRYSKLIEDLHDIFHSLGSRHLRVRWGVLSDKPDSMVAILEEYLSTHRGPDARSTPTP